jgi:tRNA acetyltransferase TAN1
MDFNLIITTYRYKEEEATQEAMSLFERLGDTKVKFDVSGVSGLILGYTFLDHFKILSIFKKILLDEPWEFRYILRVIPIEICIKTDLIKIKREVEKLVQKKILVNDSYRITVEKRHTILSTDEIISRIAENLRYKVSLDDPHWIIMIQIIGNFTGISVIKQNQIFNSTLEKRNMGLNLQ